MIRFALIFLIACNSASGSKLDEKPAAARNFVCERVKLADAKAECVPEYSDPQGIHTARVTTKGGTDACGLSPNQLDVLCGPLFRKAEQPKQDEAKPEAQVETKAAEKAAPTKGARK